MDKLKIKEGITLIALVITIVILVVLAGITIATLGGENGLLTRAKQAKQAQIESEMKEQLTLALQDLQIEKLGDATLDDVTQEWIDAKINNYDCTVKEDLSISGKKVIMEKNGIICKFLIDENLNITEIEEDGNGATLEYEALSRDGENVKILLTITDKENGLQQIEFPDGNIIYCNGNDEVSKDYEVQLGIECKVKIISKGGQVKEETILINDYYHKITKNLGEGISIDNVAVKAAYNKPYEATMLVTGANALESVKVTMGTQEIVVDKSTGKIYIEKVTGDIEITVKTRKVEIKETTIIIGTSNPPESSVNDYSQTRGIKLYINFSATLEGTTCTIVNKEDNKELPYEIASNGKYRFVATGTYNGETITKEIEVTVNKYESATGIVQYDAGKWTQEEIEQLTDLKLYDLNESRSSGDGKFKANNESGINLTFGGFKVGDSRNHSVDPQEGYGTPKYDGWQILEYNEQNGKTYVTKLVHAGAPENFVYYYISDYPAERDGYRAIYVLNGVNANGYSSYSKLNDGTQLNQRNWDVYKDKDLDKKGYINRIYPMGEGGSSIGSYYWNADYTLYGVYLYGIGKDGKQFNSGDLAYNKYGNYKVGFCFGVRPVVELNEGVYIASGSGTETDPYVLAKE